MVSAGRKPATETRLAALEAANEGPCAHLAASERKEATSERDVSSLREANARLAVSTPADVFC